MAKSNGKKTEKYCTYVLKKGKKIVYIGKTNDIENRAAQHKEDGKKFDSIQKTSRVMGEKSALAREEERLKKYRYGHKGKNPQYNKTDHG